MTLEVDERVNRTSRSGVLVVLVSVLAHRLVHHREHLPAAAVAEVAPEENGREREEDDVQVGGVVPGDVAVSTLAFRSVGVMPSAWKRNSTIRPAAAMVA